MSMISKLLREYSQIRISFEAVGKDSSTEITKVLNQLAVELTKNKWRCSSIEAPTDTIAMCAFFEMFARKIGGDATIMLCYYYSSRVANDHSLPNRTRIEGNKYRAFIVFKGMEKFNMAINLACNSHISGYRGNLNTNQFFDLLLLSDVYKAWDADSNSSMLQNLKKQAPFVAANHSTFSKQQIINEGELAHEALLNVISNII